MKFRHVLVAGAACAACGLAVAQNQLPMVALTLEYTAQSGSNGVLVQSSIPSMLGCTVESRLLAIPALNLGRHDIYMGVWRPDGSWATFSGDQFYGLSLQPGFTPVARGVEVGPTVVHTADLVRAWDWPAPRVFEITDPPGVYWGFCMALREGQTVESPRNVRAMVMTPFIWSPAPP